MIELVRSYAIAERWEVESSHGVQRVRERRISFRDVKHALMSGTRCAVQPNGRWRLDSQDLEGDELTLILFVDDGVLIITLY